MTFSDPLLLGARARSRTLSAGMYCTSQKVAFALRLRLGHMFYRQEVLEQMAEIDYLVSRNIVLF